MKNKQQLVLGIISLGVLLIVAYTLMTSDGTYEEQILEQRSQKLYNLRTSSDSPFEGIQKPTALNYYDVDEQFKVTASLELVEGHELFSLNTNDNRKQVYVKLAIATFDLGGSEYQLSIFQNEEIPSDVLIPFNDYTNGKETYGAGRYLPISKNITDELKELVIDFNLAYNPFCAYNEDFSCPIPPKENNLQIAIRAGEKTYH